MGKRFLIWFWSASGGGGSQFAARLADRLALRFGVDAVTLSLHAQDPTLHDLRDGALRTLAADVVTTRTNLLATLGGLARARDVLKAHAKDSDCVIVPMNFASAAPLSLTLDKPLVYFAHDPEPHAGDYERLGQRATQSILVRRADRVVALSNFAAAALAELGVNPAKLRTVPLGAVFRPVSNKKTVAIPIELLFAGRMIAYKGLELLADALAHISSRTDWRLTVAGHGPALTDAIKTRLALPQVKAIEDRWMSASELEALIQSCDVLLAPYTSATQSGVVAQALAFAKPCVVTPAGALAEQVGDGTAGWIAERVSAGAFAAALEATLSVDAVRAKSGAAFELARAEWERDHWRWLAQL